MQIWKLSLFFDTMSPFWSQPIQKPINLTYDLSIPQQLKCSFFSTFREPQLKRKDLRALTLVGSPRENQEQDPLAVLHLDS